MTDKEFWENIRIDRALDSVWKKWKSGMTYDEIESLLKDDPKVWDAFNSVVGLQWCGPVDDGRCVDNFSHCNELGSGYSRNTEKHNVIK